MAPMPVLGLTTFPGGNFWIILNSRGDSNLRIKSLHPKLNGSLKIVDQKWLHNPYLLGVPSVGESQVGAFGARGLSAFGAHGLQRPVPLPTNCWPEVPKEGGGVCDLGPAEPAHP